MRLPTWWVLDSVFNPTTAFIGMHPSSLHSILHSSELDMESYTRALLLFVLFLVVGDVLASRETRSEGRDDKFRDLQPRKPKEVFTSEGGRIEAWDPKEFSALCDAELGVKRLTLEPQGLALPCYKDAPVLKVITKGAAKVGIINPLADKVIDRKVFAVRRGDVIAVPRGIASWFYNDGEEGAEILEVADTSNSPRCGCFQSFHLAGGEQEDKFSSVLHGFSKDLLAHAWDVDEDTVQRILKGQKGAAIIKVDERTRKSMRDYSSNTLFTQVDFVYRLGDAEPDVRVRNAGELRLLNSFKLPILKHLQMGAACVKMEAGALTAPGWIHNAHKVLYVDGGNGRIQVVRENGERVLDADLEEGSLVVVPANHPSVKLAGDQGFRYASIFTSDMPVESFLAGRNSVYKGMPQQVVSSIFQIDERLQQKLSEQRREEAYLFPSRRQSRKERRAASFQTLVDVQKMLY